MARGLPCVASKVGGIPELLPEEDMVPPDDPVALATVISSVLARPDRRREMAERNLQRAGDYSSEKLKGRRNRFYGRLRILAESSNV
jgi:phosphatidylinositol alpha-1,6-mannosyltransferase